MLGRYLIDGLMAQRVNFAFPISTFLINCVGSLLIGTLFALGQQKNLISHELLVALTVGLLGGFTTFSAFSIQALQLLQTKQYVLAITYFLGSPLLGLLFAFLGLFLGGVFSELKRG